jgi:hypothetical protein
MTLPDLLSACHAARVELYLDGDDVHYRAPTGALTSELRGALRTCKAELGAALAALRNWNPDRAAVVVGDCAQIVATGLSTLTAPQLNVAEVYLGLARQYAERRHKLLWTMLDFLRDELARWHARPSIGVLKPATILATT